MEPKKSQNGIIIGALIVVVALGIIFIYAGNGKDKSAMLDNNADANTASMTPPPQPLAEDDPQMISQEFDSVAAADLQADFKDVDAALTQLQ